MHLNDLRCMLDGYAAGAELLFCQAISYLLLVANKNDIDVLPLIDRLDRPLDIYGRGMISPHSIKSDLHRLFFDDFQDLVAVINSAARTCPV